MTRVSKAMVVGAVMVVTTLVAPLIGQDAESDNRLRALLRPVPLLPVEHVVVALPPSLRLEGISAVTADPQGRHYVIHRPAQGDLIVVPPCLGRRRRLRRRHH